MKKSKPRMHRLKPGTLAKPKSTDAGRQDIAGTADAERQKLLGKAAIGSVMNAAVVVSSYQSNILGGDVPLLSLVDALNDSTSKAKAGDLSTLEAMLVGQATALQSIFTSLARRASTQEHLRQYEAFMGLALKAQNQSRATISALVDLKYPRQPTFVKQANIAHGPQQINNGAAPAETLAHAEESEPQQNKLLEADHGQPGGRLDTRAAQAAGGTDPAMDTVGKVHRANERGR